MCTHVSRKIRSDIPATCVSTTAENVFSRMLSAERFCYDSTYNKLDVSRTGWLHAVEQAGQTISQICFASYHTKATKRSVMDGADDGASTRCPVFYFYPAPSGLYQ